MKLWEVFKELDENPNKRFELNSYCDNRHELSMNKKNRFCHKVMTEGGIEIPNSLQTGNFFESPWIDKDSEWEESVLPIPWQEAIKAWVNHKRIRCENNGRTYTYDWNIAENGEMVAIEDGASFSIAEIQNGNWFIERS